MAFFTSIADARQKLAKTGYLVDEELATVVYLGDALGKPIMLEGRTTEQKETFMRLLTEAAITALGSPPETVRVILHENSPNNWSVAGIPKSKR